MPRQTNASRILNEARERMEKAQHRVQETAQQLEIAQAVFNNLQVSYYALERALAPKPRKKAEAKPAPAKEADKKADLAKCGCGEPWGSLIHDKSAGYANYHPFVPSAQRAGRRSSRKGAEERSTASSETDTESVSDVQSVAAGG